MDEALAILLRAGEQDDDSVNLGETALALSAIARPDADMSTYRDHLDSLIKQVKSFGNAATLDDRLRVLRKVLVVNHKYRGDDDKYDDFRNLDIMKVIDGRRGMPVALGLIYLHVGNSLGWRMTGVNLPGNGFLVKIDAVDGRAIIDPFRSGKTCSPEELAKMAAVLAHAENGDEPAEQAQIKTARMLEMGRKDVLLRLQNSIKSRQLGAKLFDDALSTVESMVLIAPLNEDLWYEKGLLHAELGHMKSAIDAFTTLKGISGDKRHIEASEIMLERLKKQLN